MPLYEFFCENCGTFETWRSLKEASEPQNCPQCQMIARRIYTAPGLVKTPAAIAQARYHSEKSAHEPEVITRERPPSKQPAQTVSQSHERPWQVGH